MYVDAYMEDLQESINISVRTNGFLIPIQRHEICIYKGDLWVYLIYRNNKQTMTILSMSITTSHKG